MLFIRMSCRAFNNTFHAQPVNVREKADRAIVFQIFFVTLFVRRFSTPSIAGYGIFGPVLTELNAASLPNFISTDFLERNVAAITAEAFHSSSRRLYPTPSLLYKENLLFGEKNVRCWNVGSWRKQILVNYSFWILYLSFCVSEQFLTPSSCWKYFSQSSID